VFEREMRIQAANSGHPQAIAMIEQFGRTEEADELLRYSAQMGYAMASKILIEVCGVQCWSGVYPTNFAG
jgi:hypothetical protein